MSNTEFVFFIFMFAGLTLSQLFILRGYYRYIKLSKNIIDRENKIRETFQSPMFYSVIFSIKNFNNWFKNNKNENIYAHAGIYLRTDKLSEHHVYDYVEVITNGLLSKEDFDENTIMMFKENIRQDWLQQLKDKNK